MRLWFTMLSTEKDEEAKPIKEKDNQGKEIRQAAMETSRSERNYDHVGN